MTTGALVVGALAGLALMLVLSTLVPARPPVAVVLDHLHRQPPARPSRPLPEGSGRAARLVAGLTRRAEASGLAAAVSRRVEIDLRVVGMSRGDYVVRRLAWAVGAGVSTLALAAAASSVGAGVPLYGAGLGAVAMAMLGWLVPAVTVRSGAKARRDDFTYALSAFVDLLTVALSGGLGVDEALERSAAVGEGWAFGEIRRALATAQHRKEAPWASASPIPRVEVEREIRQDLRTCLMVTESAVLTPEEAVQRGFRSDATRPEETTVEQGLGSGPELNHDYHTNFGWRGSLKIYYEEPAQGDTSTVEAHVGWTFNGTCVTGWGKHAYWHWLNDTGWTDVNLWADWPGSCAAQTTRVYGLFKNGVFCFTNDTFNEYNTTQYTGWYDGGASWSWNARKWGGCNWLLTFHREAY